MKRKAKLRDRARIDQIVTNFLKVNDFGFLAQYPPKQRRWQLTMSLIACHLNGTPLRLEVFAKCERSIDLVHDVCGIHNRVSRTTGKMPNDHWLPRFFDGKAAELAELKRAA